MKNIYSLVNPCALPRFRPAREIYVDERECGTWTFVSRDERMTEIIAQYFGQRSEGLLLKIWQYPLHSDDWGDVLWGRHFNAAHHRTLNGPTDARLLESLKVQNFAAQFGLAPRVFGLCLIESQNGSLHLTALMEDACKLAPGKSQSDRAIMDEIEAFCTQYGLQAPFADLATPANFVNGYCVDWQYASTKSEHLSFVRANYLEHTQFGDSKYQTAPGLDIDVGIRDTRARLSDLGLDGFTFNGATVLDIGCNGGQFLNYAAANGARYCCGADWPDVVRAASFASNYLGHFNIQYIGESLHMASPRSQTSMSEPFDLVLLLSMTTHIGTPEYLHDLGKRLIVEVNHPHQVEETLAELEKHWWVELYGKATDHGDRKIFHCRSKRHYSEEAARKAA